MVQAQPPHPKTSFTLDYRIVIGALVLIIAGMLFMWRPWEPGKDARTIEVTGQATLTAVPDEFVFYPAYEFKNADRAAALADLTKKSNEVVAKLKELNVPESGIKTNSNGYDYPLYKEDASTPTYTLSLTVTVGSKELAQKVQDYLLTTTPTGSVSPQADFSDKARNELENKARDEASKDARAKAEQSAKNLGFSLGVVKTVNDGAGFGGSTVYPTRSLDATASSQEKLTIQPGENELTYTVTVTYFVR